MKNKLFYLRKINIAKVLLLGCIFIMSLFVSGIKVEAKPDVEVLSSTYYGNSDDANAQTINNLIYIQGTGISDRDGITFKITSAYDHIDDYTAIAVWEQGFSSSAGKDFEDYDRWYIYTIACPEENYVECANSLDDSVDKAYIAKNSQDKFITYGYNKKVYYIVESQNNKDSDYVTTDADFSNFFINREITYTYRIRNRLSANYDIPSFGYKEIHINFWKPTGEGAIVDDDDKTALTIEYGLAKPIDDVEAYTNYNNPSHSTSDRIVCADNLDTICIDYVDSNGVPSQSTTREKVVNIYLPNTTIYSHKSTTADSIKDSYRDGTSVSDTVIAGNTIYAINYFCEGNSITTGVISNRGDNYTVSCDQGTLREYLYVESELISEDINSISEFKNNQTYFLSTTYQATLTVDSRGNYVVIIRDVFGNTNSSAIINVEDIINQALLAYFKKSNAKEDVREVNGWHANEFITNDDVHVSVTMSATTVIKIGLPLKEAETTLLDNRYVKEVRYWRVDGSDYDEDICEEDVGNGCAIKPTTEGSTTLLYSRTDEESDAYYGGDYVSFEGNVITMKIHSNGRYRFYIETFSGNNTDNDGANPIKGEQKNPRVEVYKIDKSAPEILFGGSDNSNCTGNNCEYIEKTYPYYQGSGVVSGSVINKLVTGSEGTIKIDYAKNLIYYVSANPDTNNNNPILSSASDSDRFFTYLMALYNSETYLKEVLVNYDNETELYSYSDVTQGGVTYTLVDSNELSEMSEEAYREFILRNNIKYTAYSLATNYSMTIVIDGNVHVLEQNNIDIEFIDRADGTTPICNKLRTLGFAVDLNSDGEVDQRDCVNYYLDHGIDFDIKITAYDVVEQLVRDNNGTITGTINVLGTPKTKIIHVDVVDNTAPGFNSIINRYNVGTDCRVELGNMIGGAKVAGTNKQDINMIFECYGVTSVSGDDTTYNFEDNVFKNLYTQEQTVNKRSNVKMYILSKETNKWISLDDGYTPNRSGNYAMLIIISDDANACDGIDCKTTFDLSGVTYHDEIVANDTSITVNGNAIGLLVSYYVDKKIVLVNPNNNDKKYGEVDPVFSYCVSINKNTTGIREYLEAPFKDMSVFTELGCSEYNPTKTSVSLSDEIQEELFKGNKGKANFTGALTRQESGVYNNEQFNESTNIINNYVGLYKVVLGTLNITGIDTSDNHDLSFDYIVKIDPNNRSENPQLAKHENKCNIVLSQNLSDGTYIDPSDEDYASCYDFEDDDDFFVESNAIFTIRQVTLVVSASGSSKVYGEVDPNYENANKNKSNSKVTATASAYLNGYSIVSGIKYSDTVSVILGVLRRQTGEDVGMYSICNYRGTTYNEAALTDTIVEDPNDMLVLGGGIEYTSCATFDPYSDTVINEESHRNGILEIDATYIASRALYIETNKRDGYYKTLNVTTDERNNNFANYVIKYQASSFAITPAKMIVQPTPGQRREYSYSGVDEVKPWEIIVYGEKTFTKSANLTFNGYTANSLTYVANSANDYQSVDTPNAKLDEEHYNNATEIRDNWYIVVDGIRYTGFKTNETYSMFEGRLALTPGDFTYDSNEELYKEMNAGWYTFNVLGDDKSTLELLGNSRNQCVYSNYTSLPGSGGNYSVECRNYDLTLDLEYRNEDGYKNGDRVEGETIEVVYKSKLGYCKTTTLGDVSDIDIQCADEISSNILFEVYRREIILEFNSMLEKVPSNDAHMVYGYRYDYYNTNLFEIKENSLNKNHLENHLFYCYPSYEDGLVGVVTGVGNTCTQNEWYGLTKNDSWVNVGLEFHLHSTVSGEESDYYTTGEDYAIPAGRYYVYSTIKEEARQNYKYNYLGGTLTIKTLTVGLTLTSYSKEYGDTYYTNENCKIKDGSLLSNAETLISDCLDTGSAATTNTSNNTYGFVVNGLDTMDLIANNFAGRPTRETKINAIVDVNGLQENVGIYRVSDGTIKSIHNNTFNNTCTDNFIGDEENGCVVVGGDINKINNYMVANDTSYVLTYYLLKNGSEENGKDYSNQATDTTIINPGNKTVAESTVTITPAYIDITVAANQTKMYGCAYNSLNTTSEYYYDYATGYNCVSTTGKNYDLGYSYTVTGDKDYYIYNYGYYEEDYDYLDKTYTTTTINQVGKNTLSDDLLIAAPSKKGSRSSALNGGVLYRILLSDYGSSVEYEAIISAADAAQAETPAYQNQSVGTYIITLGNLNATLISEFDNYSETNNKVCNVSNIPGAGNSGVCRNYIINYYGASSVDEVHTYDSENKNDLTFTITTRVAFIYALYNHKIYGNEDPVVELTCDATLIANGVCATEGEEITLGISEYYTKYNSLAKAPYVASVESFNSITHPYDPDDVRNDVQTDVVTGSLSRKGMNDGNKDTDDIVGVYNYIYDDVTTTTYSSNNYKLNFYYRELSDGKILVKDGDVDDATNPFILDEENYDQYMAVNEDGGVDVVVDDVEKRVYFEILLRKITVKLIDFSKVYGIEDDSSFYNLGICATGDQVLAYDTKGNPICNYAEGVSKTEHGLSPTHLERYISNGTLNQALFKTEFFVRFVRSLGENVTCPSKNVTATINGYFTDRATEFTYDLGCKSYSDDVKGYEALGIIDQSRNTAPGYNYEITYESGDMIILPRTIEIIPDENQGFQYGSYTYPSLIPAITFTNELKNYNYIDSTRKVVGYNIVNGVNTVVVIAREGTVETTTITTNALGLVNGGDSRICLTNIDGTNKFCINDRQDTYDVDNTEKSTSTYTYNTDGSDSDFVTYVFNDVYQDETSTRSALDRALSADDDSSLRYNRNVRDYVIVQGDLKDHTKNYRLTFKEGVVYKVTPARVNVTPDEGQSKIYGESDKELTFKVETRYTINSTQYVTYDDNIKTILDEDDNPIVIDREAETILVEKGSTIVLNGFAYYENMADESYNYGAVKDSNKSGASAAINQEDVVGSSFDKYCYDNYNDGAAGHSIDGCSDRKISYATTTKVLVGYLYVTHYDSQADEYYDYVQRAGTYKIANGFVISDNEFDKQNYDLTFNDDIDFVINKLDINIHVNDVTKTYGEATDSYKCDIGVTCEVNSSILTANDNEKMLEFNFDISYKDSDTIIAPGVYNSQNMVLMVHAINGKYYTQSESMEDKNNFLGINVIRKNNNNTTCSVTFDRFGCEDAGSYDLVVRKFEVVLETAKDNSTRYDDNYNLMVDNVSVEFETVDNTQKTYVVVNASTHVREELESISLVKSLVHTLTINQREVDIFVNTNLNITETNYFEIEQNIEVPTLPVIDNSYNLTGYTYDKDAPYHGIGENASSKSDDPNLGNTYGDIVWGGQPAQVRIQDALVGQVAYCNEARNGDNYSDTYPDVDTLCTGSGTLVYNANKSIVNTSTKDKFILITRDVESAQGLKIRPNPTGDVVTGNQYEIKNYKTKFYPGAVHVVGDDKDPVLTIGNKDYYIEANAFYDEENDRIIGAHSSIGAILEYLTTTDTTSYILANVNSDGNLYITLPTKDIVITQASLWSQYGSNNPDYQGIVSGIEQELVYPFTSDYAHLLEAKENSKEGSYLNETNITMLEELITTFIKWFDVSSYDNGQYLNGEYLQRKFDKYYYIAINKHGYDIANDIDNDFAINKVGTYDVSFYVMDNAGRVSKDGNIARLHIIDTTAPELGVLNLYSAPVKCDANCDAQDNWYIDASEVRLAAFNRYRKDIDGDGNEIYILDTEGEYIYYTGLGNDASPYKLISELREDRIITTRDYVDYISTSTDKYMAYGVVHYSWSSNAGGVHLTITGGKDNSYTVVDNSQASQWQHYYSLDGGSYWVSYETKTGMSAYSALISDGTREINIITTDTGVSISDSESIAYSFTYDVCYGDCKDIEVIYKVKISGETYEFTDSQVKNRSFMFNDITECVINKQGTLVTCIENNTATVSSKLEGNEFTYKGNNYIILGNNVLTKESNEFVARMNEYSLELDGVTYRYDIASGILYKESFARFGVTSDSGVELKIGDVTYLIVGSDIKLDGNTVTSITDYTFILEGMTYNYIVDADEDYYYAYDTYKVYQDSFRINGITYSFTQTGNMSVGDARDVVTIKSNTRYTNTYTLYDKYLKGLTVLYTDSASGVAGGLSAGEEIIIFTTFITDNVAWNQAESDEDGYVDEELSEYLNYSLNTKYHQDKKTAYLDTTSPLVGLTMYDSSNNVVRYGDSNKLFTYEYGYYNTTQLKADYTYKLRTRTYRIDMTNMLVEDDEENTYPIVITEDEDPNKAYAYEINYVTYYIDSEIKNIYWLPAYTESYVGGKDTPKGGNINAVEVAMYNVNASVRVGKITTDTIGEYRLMNERSTNTALSSGVGSTKYKTNGTNNLYDFIYLGVYGMGIYHEDIDYVVSYVDPDDNTLKQVNLKEQFKACYDNYTDGEGNHMITQDCAQAAIGELITPRGTVKKDITYDIYYIVRDKAGNASAVVAKGVIYATIYPSTNVIIQNIAASETNSEIVAVSLDDFTYQVSANQGVSTFLLEEAFSLNYVKTSTGKNYNNQATMTIYKEDELIASEVKGVNFTNYIDSSEIADYKIVYNLTTTHTPTFGDEIVVHGDEVTLYLSITSPQVDETDKITIEGLIGNDSNIIGIVMFIGFIFLGSLFVAFMILRKRR